jgi:hypothetical protein
MLNQLLLITQLHRSGGTLFSQLLDGHSEIQAHPHELFIGKPEKWDWPQLGEALENADETFELLKEEKIAAIGQAGVFIKPGSNKAAKGQEVPFHYDIDAHRQRFSELFGVAPKKTQRLAIQLYFHTFFSSWPEYRASGHERYVSCFLPHILLHPQSMSRMFGDFPDLLVVSLLRRPDTWIHSLVNHVRLDLADTQAAVKHLTRWKRSIKMIVALHGNPSIHSFATSYEVLVSDTRREMLRFCQSAGLRFEPVLLTPTVGGFPVLPNSSYRRTSSGVNRDSLALRESLPKQLGQIVEERFLPLYHKAVETLDIPVQTSEAVR